jgi:hypothetical protein
MAICWIPFTENFYRETSNIGALAEEGFSLVFKTFLPNRDEPDKKWDYRRPERRPPPKKYLRFLRVERDLRARFWTFYRFN